MRRDLRLTDHAALAKATRSADSVAVAFVFDTNILGALSDRDDRRVTMIHRSLQEVDEGLRRHGSRLVVLHGDPAEKVPELAARLEADLVVAARDYEPYARDRDSRVARSLRRVGSELRLVRDTVTIEPDELVTQAGTPFTVFTPFSKAWRARFSPDRAAEEVPDLGRLRPETELRPVLRDWPIESIGFETADLWQQPGESAARRRLADFVPKMQDYGRLRDFPAADSTSVLSPDLRFGTISIRELVRTALADGSPGSDKWLSELIWREFYQHILFHFPHVVDRSFRPEFADLEWPGSDEHFEAWCAGHTGYPIVDAAMRCFNATGWMHNRLRMVVAMFLTKDLLVDWRKGEQYFARYLIDFELASNNGGWQWSSSTGCDAQPYFRIFNPWLQSVKFDPEGKFIRRWVPEIRGLSNERIHAPHEASMFEQIDAGCIVGQDYPHPIVDHARQRERAIRLLESVRKDSQTVGR
ncbi:MAG: deoxyribodipyrimidine photo-lyase [Fimbriimonadaceae bacterium]